MGGSGTCRLLFLDQIFQTLFEQVDFLGIAMPFFDFFWNA
jgi:hypothetical protein